MSELYHSTQLRKLRQICLTWILYGISSNCSLPTEMELTPSRQCQPLRNAEHKLIKTTLIFLASALVHILFLFPHMRRTSRETVITLDRTHFMLLFLFWALFFFLLPEPVVEICGWGVNNGKRTWILTTLSGCLRPSKAWLQSFGSSTAFSIHF